ncbi:acyl-CoA dehydrogenase family protein [Cupriavidus sp. L7L]|uniref:acyl-CoA dehydrogenase family protein n=1 Tax=Cupriavidus sp. L7L TaxID=2546443 RepID=UPI0010541EC1|nr:acyl-CoA dehydrogenase family protein [Cupriavidus sp. L7L]TDF64534.1 pimeloyl-CoA dehydrogenase large subunit [Cupriavidus sp. L7L]
MDLNYTPAELSFHQEVRDFLAENLPDRLSKKVAAGCHLSKAEHEEWHAIVNRKGWLASHWPVEYGGTGWNAIQRFIFEHECALANAPRIIPFGLSMLAPVIIRYGTAAQKKHWLPRLLEGADWWCQGYSEPGSGSDLASVRTTAVRQGDHYIVNGQKTWTTQGHFANMIFCLVRTDLAAKKQQGISFLLVDLSAPGVEMRPIVTLDGEHEVNEVFFTDVRVPVENLVGEENRGWDCAKYLLTYERTGVAGVGHACALLERVKRAALERTQAGVRLIDSPSFAARLAQVEIELEAMKTTNLRVIAAVDGGGVPGAESSMLKVKGTEIRQELTALLRVIQGPYARVMPDANADLSSPMYPGGPTNVQSGTLNYLNQRKLSIYGGSNEIQRNIIAKAMLGL